MRTTRRNVEPKKGGHGERGVTAVLAAVLALLLLGVAALALNLSYSRLVQRELQAAADSAAHAAAISLCARRECWEEAKRAAIVALGRFAVHGRFGDATGIDLDPDGGPTWTDERDNLIVTIERGQWVQSGVFTSLEPGADLQNLVNPELIANAVRVAISRPHLDFLATPGGFRTGGYSVAASAAAVKGDTRADCVAPFALPACALAHAGRYSEDTLAAADRLFTRASRYCADGENGSCEAVVPEFFYDPTDDRGSPAVVDAPPTACKWANPRFADAGDHFGVVGLPLSAGQVSEERIREIVGSANHPCVPAEIGEEFQILPEGLTDRQTDDALWAQMSVSLDAGDAAHPPFSTAYANTRVETRTHDDSACAAADRGFGACNSRRYVYNGVRGETPFPAGRFASGFQPSGVVDGALWPAVTSDTPMWHVEIPVIAPRERLRDLECPGGTDVAPRDPLIDPGVTYEIVGFLKVNLFDTDVGWAPPLNPALLQLPAGGPGEGGDAVWGFANGQSVPTGHPDCYRSGSAIAADGGTTSCQPCDVVRGRVAEVTAVVAADQDKDKVIHLTDVVEVQDGPPPARPLPTPAVSPTLEPTPAASLQPAPSPSQAPSPDPSPQPSPSPRRLVCQCEMQAPDGECLRSIFDASSESSTDCWDHVYSDWIRSQTDCASVCSWWACYADGAPIGVYTQPLPGAEQQFWQYDAYLAQLCLSQMNPIYGEYWDPYYFPPLPDPLSFPRPGY